MKDDHRKQRKAAIAVGVAVHIFGILFLLFWCWITASMGAWFMLPFAIPAAVFLVFRLVLMLRQAKNDSRDAAAPHFPPFHSPDFDIPNPFENASQRETGHAKGRRSPRFCPSCSFWIHNDSQFCPKCGRWIS